MSSNDQHYYVAGSAEERTRATSSGNPHAARIHLEMAQRYETWAAAADHNETRPTVLPPL